MMVWHVALGTHRQPCPQYAAYLSATASYFQGFSLEARAQVDPLDAPRKLQEAVR